MKQGSLARGGTPSPLFAPHILQGLKTRFYKQLVGRAFAVQSPAHISSPGSQPEPVLVLKVWGGTGKYGGAVLRERGHCPAQRHGLQVSSQEYEVTLERLKNWNGVGQTNHNGVRLLAGPSIFGFYIMEHLRKPKGGARKSEVMAHY